MSKIRLDGPRVAPASGGAAKQVVVFLHGYGADGNDLIALGREWAAVLPDAAFVSPHAPNPCAGAPMGREWFPLSFRDPGELRRGVVAAHAPIDAFLDAELSRTGLAPAKLALVGFSQGGMMALHAGTRRKEKIGAIVSYSGVLAGADRAAAEAITKPPVLLVHGELDDVIPFDALAMSRDALARAGFAVEWHAAPRIGHGIDAEGLRLGGLFLRDALRNRNV